MTDAPVPYLKRLAAGCWCMAIAGPATVGCFLAAYRLGGPGMAGAAAAAGLLWLAGVCVVTRPRETTARATGDLATEWKHLRPVSRILAAGWPLAPLMYAGAAQAMQAAIAGAAANGTALVLTPTLIGLYVLTGAFLFAGVCGLVPLSIILVNLCDWAGDGALSERLRIAASAIACGTLACAISLPVVSLFGSLGPLYLLLYGVGIVGVFLVLGGFLFYLFCTIQLAGMSLWAVSNSITAIERDERVALKKAEHAEEMVSRVLRSQASSAIPATQKPKARKPTPPGTTRAGSPARASQQPPRTDAPPGGNGGTDSGPYGLAPDDRP